MLPTTTLINALDLIDKGKIIKYIAGTSQRELFAVEPSSSTKGRGKYHKTYKCLSNNYCTCQSFAYSVVTKKESRYCKHLLAVMIAEALNEYQIKYVKDSEMGLLLLDED